MSILVGDLILSGIVYVILTYLTFRLMRTHRSKGNDQDGGQAFELTAPKIDLPPGISWPVSGPVKKQEPEEELV